MSSPPAQEDQARLLEDALSVVRQQTMLMRRCLETPGKLMDALKCRYVVKTCNVMWSPCWQTQGVLIHLQLHPCIGTPDKQSGTEAVL